jgi:hypothetical protein
MLNELISNALKHAFPEGREGRVDISAAGAEPTRSSSRWATMALACRRISTSRRTPISGFNSSSCSRTAGWKMPPPAGSGRPLSDHLQAPDEQDLRCARRSILGALRRIRDMSHWPGPILRAHQPQRHAPRCNSMATKARTSDGEPNFDEPNEGLMAQTSVLVVEDESIVSKGHPA